MARHLIGSSECMDRLKQDILKVGQHDGCVLISGETGTGKEVVAEAIHKASGRQGNFVAVNCLALPTELFESEMFGSSKGSFTGSTATKNGLFTHARNGTILLDEVDSIPAVFQGKLLRVIQEKRVRKVGALDDEGATCRILVASNADLAAKVESGSFRRDLYYRLEMFCLQVKPLRDRREDIPALVKHISKRRVSSECNSGGFSASAIQTLQEHDWPGNVRELENVVVRSLVMNDVSMLEPEHILFSSKPGMLRTSSGMSINLPPEGITLKEIEIEAILLVQAAFDDDIKRMAKFFQTSPARMQKLVDRMYALLKGEELE